MNWGYAGPNPMYLFPSMALLNRTVRLNAAEKGTGLVVHRKHRAFIITAAHVVPYVNTTSEITIDLRRRTMSPRILRKRAASDTAVLEIAAEDVMDISADSITLGGDYTFAQDVVLAGFPAGMGLPIRMNDGRGSHQELSPFFRKGCISNSEGDRFWIDTIIQKGFSGGPVIANTAEAKTGAVIGFVLAGHVFPADVEAVQNRGGVTILSGFTKCQLASVAINLIDDIIDAHP